jgi:hypothetical protein
MSKTRLDESRWPLVVFTAVGEQTEEDFDAFLEDCDRVLRRRLPHGTIFDGRRSSPIGPKLRKRQVAWLSRNDALLRAYVVGSGVLIKSAVQRGALRAIMWMRPLPFPYVVESSFEAARRFVCSRLDERGCDAPPMFNWGNLAPASARSEPLGERPRRLAEPR